MFAFCICKVVPTSKEVKTRVVLLKTTKEDITKAFGKPTETSSTPGGDTWTYDTTGSPTKKQVHTTFYFNSNGVVRYYEQFDN